MVVLGVNFSSTTKGRNREGPVRLEARGKRSNKKKRKERKRKEERGRGIL